MGKLGVVIFNNDYSDEGLAALQWASASLLPKEFQLARILLVKEVQGRTTTIGIEEFSKHQLSALVEANKELRNNKSTDDRNRTITLFDECIKKFGTKDFHGRAYEGDNIQGILERAIKDFQLDTLVLGMAALGKTRIDLQLNSACSVVLAKMDPKPLKTTFEKFSAAPADGPAIPMKNEAETSDKK